MKIVYCINSISHLGGMERVTVAKANALAAIPGNEVWIAYTDVDDAHPAPALPLDPRVRTIDLGIRYYADDTRGLYWRLRSDTLLRRRHKKTLEKALAAITPDVVISTGQSEKYFLPGLKLPCRPAYVREFHYAKDFRRAAAGTLAGRLLARISDVYDYTFRLGRYNAVAVLTREDFERNWAHTRHAAKTCVVPNPLILTPSRISDTCSRTVVTAGRLCRQKNHASLLRAWLAVAEKHPDWNLVIYGSGALESELHEQIASLGLSDSVQAPGAVADVAEHLTDASIFVFTSLYEGFGLALLEGAACGLPMVSYACPCGPRDIISHGSDGFLVPQGDEQALAEALCRLIEDDDLRRSMGLRAVKKAAMFAPEIIAEQWMKLFKSLRP